MILLIEDREERQKHFMAEADIDLDSYNDILENMVKKKYHKFLQEIKSNSFDLNKYSIIISHKSAFGDDNIHILQKLENHCKQYNKPLVYFSGGTDTNYYENIDNELLELNSKLFYSDNIKLFLDETREGRSSILILAYGKQWKLNILLKILEKINLKISSKDNLDYEEFKLDTNYYLIDDIGIQLYLPNIESGIISIVEMKKVRSNIEQYIKKVITYA